MPDTRRWRVATFYPWLDEPDDEGHERQDRAFYAAVSKRVLGMVQAAEERTKHGIR